MTKVFLLGMALAAIIGLAGCGTPDRGSREYQPGTGWTPTGK